MHIWQHLQKPKMSRKISSLCLALLLTFTSVQAAQKTLNSISEIKRCVPEATNILELLCWFANEVSIDNHGNVRVTFEPESDYGSHHYGNFEEMLNRPPWGYKYYTVGNIHKDSSTQLPPHVRNARNGTIGWNRGRIIFSATEANGGWNVQQIYITQHSGTSVYNGTSYDPNHTYQITTNLLRELRGRPISEILQGHTGFQRSNFKNTSTRPQQFFYSNQNHVPQANPTTTHEGDVRRTFCTVLAILFVLLLIFLGNVGK